MKVALYPGSFDPFTNGHLDIVNRGLRLFDHVNVAVAENSSKHSLFTIEERLQLIGEVLKEHPNVSVVSFEGLLVDYAKETGASAIIRGLRAVSDFDYEYAIFQMNSGLNPHIETLFLLSNTENSFLSSTIIKEVARYGKDVSAHAPRIIAQALLKKFGHII